MSSVTTLEPPIRDAPLAGDQFSKSWTAYNQAVADHIAGIVTQLNDLAAQVAAVTDQVDQVTTGVTDGSDAAAGKIGEYLTASGGTVTLTNVVTANIVSLNLTAGDWDVSGDVAFSAGAGTRTFFLAGVAGSQDTLIEATFPTAAMTIALTTAVHRFSVTATTTAWVTAQAGFTGTCSASGVIRARRVR